MKNDEMLEEYDFSNGIRGKYAQQYIDNNISLKFVSLIETTNLQEKKQSFKDLDLKNRVPFMTLLAFVLVIVLISFDPPVVLLLLSAGFALSGPFFWVFGKKSKSIKISSSP